MRKKIFGSVSFFILLLGMQTREILAASTPAPQGELTHNYLGLLLVIAGILVAAKVLHLIEKIKLPPVVGELIAGIVLGNLTLIGIPFFHDFKDDIILSFLAELGVIILLFQIGLESNVGQLVKVGKTAVGVALIGAVVPFILGTYIVGPLVLPNQSLPTYLFLGASLAATSVGITARIFKDLGKLKTKAARIVLGAAVIDDILGLILLAVISSLTLEGTVSVLSAGLIFVKSFAFLILSVLIGQLLAPSIGKAFSLINSGIGTKFTLALSFGLVFAALANFIGLEPIIGAFAAGLVLDPVHFKNFKEPHLVEELKEALASARDKTKDTVLKIVTKHSQHSVEDIIEPLAFLFVPIFFVTTGMEVSIKDLLSLNTLFLATILTVVAIAGKFVSGIMIKGHDKITVGLAMIPRGEVGLIFAAIGKSLGVVSSEVFSVIVLTVLLTTIIGPLLLTRDLHRAHASHTAEKK